VKGSFLGLKHLQDAAFQMRREERRLKRVWEAYLRGGQAIYGETIGFFFWSCSEEGLASHVKERQGMIGKWTYQLERF